jgi:hypothetical protein
MEPQEEENITSASNNPPTDIETNKNDKKLEAIQEESIETPVTIKAEPEIVVESIISYAPEETALENVTETLEVTPVKSTANGVAPTSSESEAEYMEGEIRCICGYTDDDGFTIQCEQCLVWQHAICVGISKSMVPEKYFCEKCSPRPLDAEAAKLFQKNRLLTQSTAPTTPHRKPRGRPPTKKRVEVPEPLQTQSASIFGPSTPATSEPTGGHVEEYNQYEEITDCLVRDNAKPFYNELVHVSPTVNANYSMIDFYKVRDFTQLKTHAVEVRKIRSRGFQKKTLPSKFGLFSTAKLDAGKLVLDYCGEFQLKTSFGSEFKISTDKNLYVDCTQPFVLFHPSLDFVVDARKYANQARFIRRSCRPNCEIRIILAEDLRTIKIGIFAKTMIVENDEILLDIDYEHGNRYFRYECACSNPEFCLANDPFSSESFQRNHTILFNDHLYDGYVTDLSGRTPRKVRLNANSDGEQSSITQGKKRGRKPKVDLKVNIESSSESSSDDELDENGSLEVLSPNSLEQRKLSREERKIQSYMQSFQRLEERKEKKKKGKRGRPKREDDNDKKERKLHKPYTPIKITHNDPSMSPGIRNISFSISNSSDDDEPKRYPRKKLLMKIYVEELKRKREEEKIKNEEESLLEQTKSEIPKKPKIDTEMIISANESLHSFQSVQSLQSLPSAQPSIESQSLQSLPSAVSQESFDVDTPVTPITPSKTKLSLSEYLQKRKSNSSLNK